MKTMTLIGAFKHYFWLFRSSAKQHLKARTRNGSFWGSLKRCFEVGTAENI